MKESMEKVVNRLKPLVGHKIIRIKPTKYGDYSYTETPVTLLGFTDKAELIVRQELFGIEPFEDVMPISFTDSFWISYRKAKRAKNNSLNQWKGRYVKRIVPVMTPYFDESFMGSSSRCRLIAASKHHIVLQSDGFGFTSIKNYLYANPKDWTLDE